jgi:CDP-diacylglycerol--glycerol-3-phosphate 3-phosphatidyltransferase
MQKVPNFLTILRVVLIPFFVILMEIGTNYSTFIALIVFIFAAITDFVDGFIARSFSAVSDFGKLLDPVADKLLVMAALITLVAKIDPLTGNSLIPAWLVILVLSRETWVTGLRLVAVKDGIVLPADRLGKLKAFFQMIAIVALMLNNKSNEYFDISYHSIGVILLLLSAFFSFFSAYKYTKKVLISS